MTRLEPLEPPFAPEVGQLLERMMPPGVPPIALFRLFGRNLPMAEAMHGWGSYELSRRLSLSLREREIVIDRTCARCGCEYEWGIHVAFFAERAAITPSQLASLTHGDADDPCWESRREQLLIRAVDALHDHADIDDHLWSELNGEFTTEQLLDLTLLCGWYHAISYVAVVARLESEPGSPTFSSVRTSRRKRSASPARSSVRH